MQHWLADPLLALWSAVIESLIQDSYDTILFSSDFYENGAMMLEEESIVISGLLVGLNVIDCNIGIKDEDLDQPVSHKIMHNL